MEIPLEKTRTIGIALAIFGFLALMFLLPEIRTMDISQVGKENLGTSAKFYGTIRDFELRNGNAFFTLENGASISAVYFKPSPEELVWLRENSTIEAVASVSIYRGELELIIERVQKID